MRRHMVGWLGISCWVFVMEEEVGWGFDLVLIRMGFWDVDMREGEQGREELETLFNTPGFEEVEEVTICYGVRRGLKHDVERLALYLFNTHLLPTHTLKEVLLALVSKIPKTLILGPWSQKLNTQQILESLNSRYTRP